MLKRAQLGSEQSNRYVNNDMLSRFNFVELLTECCGVGAAYQ